MIVDVADLGVNVVTLAGRLGVGAVHGILHLPEAIGHGCLPVLAAGASLAGAASWAVMTLVG